MTNDIIVGKHARKVSDMPEASPQAKPTPLPPPPLELESRSASDISEATSPAKRRLLSGLGAGGGVLGVSALVPATWIKPVVDSVILPTHAQPSPAPGDGGGDPAPGDGGGGTPPGDGGGPPTQEVRGAPTSVTAVVLSDESGLSVTWDAAPTGVDSYTVSYRKSDEQDFRADVATVAADAPSLTHTFTFPQGEAALQAGDTFTVEVRAVYGTNGTQAATEHEATDATLAFGQEQRGAPTNVTANLTGTTRVRVLWDAAPTGVDRYTLRYRRGTDAYRTGARDTATIAADAARLQHTFIFPQGEAPLQLGDTFTVEVTAVYDQNGTQAASTHPAADATPGVVASQLSAPPRNVTVAYPSATLGATGMDVAWTAPTPLAGTTLAGYYLRWAGRAEDLNSPHADASSPSGAIFLSADTTSPYRQAVTELQPGRQYFILLRAIYDDSSDGSDTTVGSPNTVLVFGPRR